MTTKPKTVARKLLGRIRRPPPSSKKGQFACQGRKEETYQCLSFVSLHLKGLRALADQQMLCAGGDPKPPGFAKPLCFQDRSQPEQALVNREFRPGVRETWRNLLAPRNSLERFRRHSGSLRVAAGDTPDTPSRRRRAEVILSLDHPLTPRRMWENSSET